jgi:hypothetical protein
LLRKWFSSASQASRAMWPRCWVMSYRLGEMVPQIHDLTTLSIWSQVRTLMYVVSRST